MSRQNQKSRIIKAKIFKFVEEDIENNMLQNPSLFNHKTTKENINKYKLNSNKHFIVSPRRGESTNEHKRFSRISSIGETREDENISLNNISNLSEVLENRKLVCSYKKLKKQNSSLSRACSTSNNRLFSTRRKSNLFDKIQGAYDKLQKIAFNLKKQPKVIDLAKSKVNYNELYDILEFKGIKIAADEAQSKKNHSENRIITLKKDLASDNDYYKRLFRLRSSLHKRPSIDASFKPSSNEIDYKNYINYGKCNSPLNFDTVNSKEEAKGIDSYLKGCEDFALSSGYNSGNNQEAKQRKSKISRVDNYEEYESNILRLVKCDTTSSHFNLHTESDFISVNTSNSLVNSNSYISKCSGDFDL
jgi:hypothetical protein